MKKWKKAVGDAYEARAQMSLLLVSSTIEFPCSQSGGITVSDYALAGKLHLSPFFRGSRAYLFPVIRIADYSCRPLYGSLPDAIEMESR